MALSRIAALLRTVSTYRVEACFLAALVFTLARQPDDRQRHVEVHSVRTAHTIVHEVSPLPAAAPLVRDHVVERPVSVGMAVPATRVHVVAPAQGRKIVVRRHSAPRADRR